MTIDLLPGHGVRMPAPLPGLRFGLTEATVRRLLAPHHEALPGGVHPIFVCGSSWALYFTLPGVGVTLCSGSGERLRAVFLSRRPVEPLEGAAACPVGLHGVDVFGRPAHEVVEALRAGGLPVPDPAHGNVRYDTLRLSRNTPVRWTPAGGRKPRHEPPFTFGLVSLSAPEAHPSPLHQEST
ncbi:MULTISPECIES: hypothetical protein [unclassified Kitasatospora]|uniref:hypothetical protein n=1 Tax=unclassified Kitasatospora TaxID=2633591 RepID=UPI00380DFBAB